MNTSSIIKYSILGIMVIFLFIFISNLISFSNTEIDLRNRFNQKYSERTAFYDKMYKTLSQKSQIAVKNDSSFRTNIDIIMEGRKDAYNKGRLNMPKTSYFKIGHEITKKVISNEKMKEILVYINNNPNETLVNVSKKFNIKYQALRDVRRSKKKTYKYI